MAQANKTTPTLISVEAFLKTVEPDTRRCEAETLLRLFETATMSEAKMWGPSIIGFGVHHYRYDSGRTGETPTVSFSPRKAQLVIYGLNLDSQAEQALTQLGKHTRGKGCLYIKRLVDIDQNVLSPLIETAWQAYGADKTDAV
jgi:hypothetical protein